MAYFSSSIAESVSQQRLAVADYQASITYAPVLLMLSDVTHVPGLQFDIQQVVTLPDLFVFSGTITINPGISARVFINNGN